MTRLSTLRLHCLLVLTTIVLFISILGVNHLLFKAAEFVPGINWVYLPAGVRLFATLVFGWCGALGLLLVSWFVNFYFFFEDDFSRAFMGGILATVAPYGVYLLSKHWFGLNASLHNLSTAKLLVLMVIFSIASPALHHLWFYLSGREEASWAAMAVMAIGDFNGTVAMLYLLKLGLWAWPPASAATPR